MSQIEVTFDDQSNNRDGYRFYTSTDSGSTWTLQDDIGTSALQNGTVTHTITGLDQNTAYHVKASVYTEHLESEVVYGRVAKLMSRNPILTADAQVDASRAGMAKTRSAASQADGEISATRASSKTRASQITADGHIEATRSGTSKARNPTIHAGGEIEALAQFSETFPSEMTRDLEWDYDNERLGFLSEWVYNQAVDGHGTASLYIDGAFGRVDPAHPVAVMDYSEDGNAVDERSQPQAVYATDQPVTFPRISGKSGYYRVLLKDLRPNDYLRHVQFGPSHT